MIVPDPNAPPLWARFYEIDTNRPFFCGRDGVKKYAMAEIEPERRNGYAWYGNWGRRVAERYARWKGEAGPMTPTGRRRGRSRSSGRCPAPSQRRGGSAIAGSSAPCSSSPRRSTTSTAACSACWRPSCRTTIGWTDTQYGDINAAFTLAYAIGFLVVGPVHRPGRDAARLRRCRWSSGRWPRRGTPWRGRRSGSGSPGSCSGWARRGTSRRRSRRPPNGSRAASGRWRPGSSTPARTSAPCSPRWSCRCWP